MVLAWQARLKKQPNFLDRRGRIIQKTNSATADRLLGKCKAAGTLKSYDCVIKKLETYAEENNYRINPVSKQAAANFVCYLADKQTPLSQLCKVSPALTLLHHSQGHSSAPFIQDQYVNCCSLEQNGKLLQGKLNHRKPRV